MASRAALLLCLFALAACAPAPEAAGGRVQTLAEAEAVRAGWDSPAPPTDGWETVRLMDFWDQRWPRHDGVVWYRLRWHQADTSAPVGLLVNYASMSQAVYLNGSLLARDRSLIEPLSRTWNRPRYFLVDAPLLRPGENELLARVSGLAAYQPGFGTVAVGDPEAVHEQYLRGVFKRYDIKLVTMAISAVLGVIFLLMWLLRRQDSVFGWFALTELAGAAYSSNNFAPDPWPFPGTDGWQAFIAAAYVAAGTSYAMFLLRYGERAYPRIERALGALCLAVVAVALLAPGWAGPHRTPIFVLGGAIYYTGIGWFVWRTLRAPRADWLVLSGCLLVPVLVSFHDFALFFGWVRDDTYLLSLTSALSLLGIAFALAYRFVNAMRKVEGFNTELRREVDAATAQLSATLQREHALALANTRINERLNLVRDVHDGFGGTLVGTISELELMERPLSNREMAQRLRDLRDDLRLIVDSTQEADADLARLLAPLRHRWSQRLEMAGIDARWNLHGAEGVRLDSSAALDLMRLLQEALTNVFKHSRATRAEVDIDVCSERLHLEVRDDGVGFDPAAVRDHGAGQASLRARARRLGGMLEIGSAPGGGTRVSLEFPAS